MIKRSIQIDVPVYILKTPGSDISCMRIRDISDNKKREQFEKWMGGQTRPLFITDDTTEVNFEEQDYCYCWDYIRFLDLFTSGRRELSVEWD